MGPGDAVIVLADPWLHGAGVIDAVLRDGRLLVLFWGEREEIFEALEVEVLDVWLMPQVERVFDWFDAFLGAA